jgi:hypothetical protein
MTIMLSRVDLQRKTPNHDEGLVFLHLPKIIYGTDKGINP